MGENFGEKSEVTKSNEFWMKFHSCLKHFFKILEKFCIIWECLYDKFLERSNKKI